MNGQPVFSGKFFFLTALFLITVVSTGLFFIREPMYQKQKNVLGGDLLLCCNDPVTGFYRNGYCETGPDDFGTHIVCAIMTEDFLQYTLSKGNDLITPRPAYRFPGLTAGDKWCLCILRWKEALQAGKAPPVVLEATQEVALRYVDLETLRAHSHSPSDY